MDGAEPALLGGRWERELLPTGKAWKSLPEQAVI